MKYLANFAALALLTFNWPAMAIVARTTPLKDVLAAEQFIGVVRVVSVDAAKRECVLAAIREHKSRLPFAKARVRLDGDAAAQRERQVEKLLERIESGAELVIFGSMRREHTTLYAYTNGTWIQMVSPGPASGFAFTHFEPYLRRTFKGTTAELERVVIDGLSGEKTPPPPNANEPPGLGPAIVRKSGGP